jgi:3-methyladenine DNA glycosylase AlkD
MASRRIPAIIEWLESRGTRRNREGMARYGIRSARAFGVSLQTMRPLIRQLGRDHELALALWATGWHEARVLATCIDVPEAVTPGQMEAWARDFDNWALCDAACYQLFDRTPHTVGKIRAWSTRRAEFVKRGAFAMIAGLAVHDRARPDDEFLQFMPLAERAAGDDRNFVKKAVSWALRQIGKRGTRLSGEAVSVAERLSRNAAPAARWVGRDVLRELRSAAVQDRLARREMTRRRGGRHTEETRDRLSHL